MFQNTRKLFDEFERLGIPGFDISVMQGGREVFRESRGCSDESGTPMRGTERYNIYSCSKVITCTAAMMLIEEGKLRLEDELATYFPEFGNVRVRQGDGLVKAESPITIHQLFTMTAGLSYDCSHEAVVRGRLETEGRAPTVEMMKYIAEIPLLYQPGETFHYSLGHDVLAAVVERISGKRYGEFVKERIFDPLGMKSTTFLLPDEECDTLMAQYRFVEGKFNNVGRKIQTYKLGSEYESGGAGAVSTVDDYVRFLEGLRTYRLLKRDTLELMYRDHLRDDQRATCWVAEGYGYGLGVRAPRAGYPRTDFGWGGAAGAFAAIDPVNDISLYYSQHVLLSPNANLRKDIIEAVKLDLGLPAFEKSMWCGTASTLA